MTGRRLGEQLAPVFTAQELSLERLGRIAEPDAHQEAVELGFRQRKSADLVDRVLRGDDEERRGQRVRDAIHAHLLLFHGFQQGALRLGRGAVDLVGEDHLGEQRAGLKFETAVIAVEDRGADDVGRQQVAGELDAPERQAEDRRQAAREQRLADAGNVLDQQVPVGEQAGDGEADLVLLAKDDLADFLDGLLGEAAGPDDAGNRR